MKFTRKAGAQWNGTAKDGAGTLTTQSTVLKATQYSLKTRFEEGVGTNPEELIGAAHAGCFTMQLSFLLDAAGYKKKQLNTEAEVVFEDGSIIEIQLKLVGAVPDISLETFVKIADEAKKICPVSKILNARITLSTQLK